MTAPGPADVRRAEAVNKEGVRNDTRDQVDGEPEDREETQPPCLLLEGCHLRGESLRCVP